MKGDEPTPMWGTLTDPTRRAILDLLRQRQRMGTIRRNRIKIKLTSVYVDDQEKAWASLPKC